MSRKDIAVIVQETPIHKVEVRTGVMGKRGPQGDTGPKGDKGDIGPAGQDVKVIVTYDDIILINPFDHGSMYISLNESTEYTLIILGETIVNGEDLEAAAIFFTQNTFSKLGFLPANENIKIIQPFGKGVYAYGPGSTIGAVSKGNNEWVLFGDLSDDTISARIFAAEYWYNTMNIKIPTKFGV